MKKKLVVLSGGMDSTVVLYWAVQKYGKENIEAISFNYGSKHNDKELPLAKISCKKLEIIHTIIPLPLDKYFKSDLLKSGGEIPEGHYAENNMSKTVVPLRNGIMLMIAAGRAESIDGDQVLLGSHAGDHFQYLDCREEFTSSMNTTTILGTKNRVKIVSPFNDIMKWDILKIGVELGVPFEDTWSCYKGSDVDKHCGKCGTCVERTQSFYELGLKDPSYSKRDWEQAVDFMKQQIKRFEGRDV